MKTDEQVKDVRLIPSVVEITYGNGYKQYVSVTDASSRLLATLPPQAVTDATAERDRQIYEKLVLTVEHLRGLRDMLTPLALIQDAILLITGKTRDTWEP